MMAFPSEYRIQVWGHIGAKTAVRWYWDATVQKPRRVIDRCVSPPLQTSVVQVQEAWWANFSGHGTWTLGSGTEVAGAPTGDKVTYGRTVWHGEGHMPYFMLSRMPLSPATSGWCTKLLPADDAP